MLIKNLPIARFTRAQKLTLEAITNAEFLFLWPYGDGPDKSAFSPKIKSQSNSS